MGILSSVLNPILGLVGTGIQQSNANKQAELQRQWNESMLDKQNQFSLDMWNLANEYNEGAISRGKQQLLDAGLNPLLHDINGNTTSPLESAQALGYSQPMQMNPFAEGLNQSYQSQLVASQVKKNVSEADLASVEAETRKLMQSGQVELLGMQLTLADDTHELNLKQAQKIASEIVNLDKRSAEVDAEIDKMYFDMDIQYRDYKIREAAFKFQKWLDKSKFGLAEKELAVSWFNATSQRLSAQAAQVSAAAAQTSANASSENAETNRLDYQSKSHYLELQGEQVRVTTELIPEKWKFEKRLLKANTVKSYVSSATDIVNTGLSIFNSVGSRVGSAPVGID